MKIQRPIFWHQGLFLQPQHFQLQDQAFHSRLIPFLKYHAPHFWGVCAADIDQAALGTGSFLLESGAFLFQDGSYLEVPGNALISPRRLEGAQSEGKPLKVYLGLKRWNHGAENVTVVDNPGEIGSATTRFVSVGAPDQVRDLYGNGPDAQVKRLHHLLRLFWEGELDQLGDYHLIPLAQVESSGVTRLSPAFVPPSLTI
jgi:type VI secretion system protein ImpJ